MCKRKLPDFRLWSLLAVSSVLTYKMMFILVMYGPIQGQMDYKRRMLTTLTNFMEVVIFRSPTAFSCDLLCALVSILAPKKRQSLMTNMPEC